MAATALSKTPSRSTAASWRSRRPSTWTTQEKYRDGVKRSMLALQQHGVGAQVDVDLAPHELGDHLVDVGVQQRLAAGDRHHRRAALLDRADDVLDRQPLAQDVGRVLDLPAARAREVAREQRLDLDDERVVLAAA